MSRPSLQDGDIWSAELSNASIRPFVSSADQPGALAPITDNDLDPSPNYIKSRFYEWRDRLKVSASSGLTVTYTGATVRLEDGSISAIADGSTILPNNATSYVFVNTSGAVTNALSLPNTCYPLARVQTAGGSVTGIVDLREPIIAQVAPIKLPATVSPFITGEIRLYPGTTAPAGWAFCQGQSLLVADYPALFSVIGYRYGGGGANFNLPDLRDKTIVGAGTRTVGTTGGSETAQLTVSNLPSHTHGVLDVGHAHGIFDPGHTHGVLDPGHSHVVIDPGHNHSMLYKPGTTTGPNIGQTGAELTRAVINPNGFVDTAVNATNISIALNGSNLSLQAAFTGNQVQPSTAGISIQAQGGNQPFSVMQPFLVAGNYMIYLG